MKKTEVVKTAFSIGGAITNKMEHNQFKKEIASVQRMARFGNTSADSANIGIFSLQQRLNYISRYINQNWDNIKKLSFFHDKLVKKHNFLCEKVNQQQKQINELAEEIKKLKNLKE